jgi:hypothetical protein
MEKDKYAVYGNVPLTTNTQTTGLLAFWERLTRWLLEWSVESRG